ncbi:MAG TPA: cytochrome c oxidase subunit II, partial [Solirubrobacteraceae bacterium]|nr:cytochrome c oxidase subunit II [Solirubrobacteraceae bacterium]
MARSRLKTLVRRSLAPALMALLATASPAVAGLILPEAGGGSQQAEDTQTLYVIILAIAVVVFAGVEGVLIYCLFRYRARKGRVAAQIHGNTRLEIGWTVGAAVILVFLTVATFVMLPGIKNPVASDIDVNGNPVAADAAFASTDQEAPPDAHAMNIAVDGMQYVWRYAYPSIDDKEVYSFTDMYVPVGMTITLDIRSNDVQHSWWIPELGGKMDALPGYTNKTWFKVTEPGRWDGQCAELCGRNHANMYARVIGL